MTNIAIIGSGTMGIGIAQVAAIAHCNVLLFDIDIKKTETAIEGLKNNLEKLVEKKKYTQEDQQNILSRIKIASDINELKKSHLIIEAIVEKKEVKQKLFLQLESIVDATCILASNTSSISITSIAAELQFPQRFIGIHFFNPAPILPLVEIIPSLLTDNILPIKIVDLLKSWHKDPIIVKDIPGFLVNRLARPYYGEAIRIVEENIATIEEVDAAMKHYKFKMGPFELMDLIGIDVNFAVTESIYNEYFFDAKYKPSLLQKRMVEAKLWGRKTGKGFYDYTKQKPENKHPLNEKLFEDIFMRIISMLINEAVEALRLKLATAEDIDIAMQKGVNYPKGLLAWGKEIGYKKIEKTLLDLRNIYHEERYRSSPLLNHL